MCIDLLPARHTSQRQPACSVLECSPALVLVILLILIATPVDARRESLTPEQKERLREGRKEGRESFPWGQLRSESDLLTLQGRAVEIEFASHPSKDRLISVGDDRLVIWHDI